MLHFTILLLVLAGLVSADFCPNQPITPVTLGGNLPNGAANLTDVPQGTNCTFVFNIPNNYNLRLTFNAQAGSKKDKVSIYNNNNELLYTVRISDTPIYNARLYLPARAASVRVEGVSAKMKFMLGYEYQSLANYKQITKKTGEYFSLNTVALNTFVTITASSANEKVIVSPASMPGSDDGSLQQMYVFDGDNINTANVIGRLSDFSDIRISSGNSVSIVNFGGVSSHSYALGNDASALNGIKTYTVYVTTKGSSYGGNMTDMSGSLTAYTWICTDCTTFYWTKLQFDSLGSISNKAYVSFQGQTPTHKMEQLIRYEAMTVTDSYFPQMLPTNILTLNLHLGTAKFRLNCIDDDGAWKKARIGRKGYIFSPSLWGTIPNNFNYEFRDDSQPYNFTLNIDKMSFLSSNDQMTLKIGSSVNNLYPKDQSSNNKVTGNGNYMQIGLTASVAADVRLSFEMQKGNPASAVGIMIAMMLTLFYIL